MNLRHLVVVTIMVFVTISTLAQRNYQGAYNRIGLQGGVSIFNINTGNFAASSSEGYTAGFSTRGAFYNNFDLIYGLNFYGLNVNIQARETAASEAEDVNFSVFGMQLNLFVSYNIIGQYLTIEAGPALQLNSKLTPEEEHKNYIIEGYNALRAEDLENVTRINVNGAVGITSGFESLRLWANYQYGINNFLNGLNDEGLEQRDPNIEGFKGNISLINVGVVFYL